MSSEQPNAPWIFVIDTEDYSGNFERELCAYITGRTGECGVGDDMAEFFDSEVGEPFENVVDEPDEDGGCLRPTAIWPTPGWFNNGFGGQYRADGDLTQALEDYRKVAAANRRDGLCSQYLKRWLEKPDDRAGLISAKWTEAKLKKGAAEEEAEAQKLEKATKLPKFPSYQSVAIFFDKKPTDEQIALMKERSEKFAVLPDKWRDGIRISKITGYRLIENKVKVKRKSKKV
jgi:hypothetical protein